MNLKKALIILGALALSSCGTTSHVESLRGGPPPPANATIIVAAPDIQLSILTAAGTLQPRSDWTQQASAHVAASIAERLQQEGHRAVAFEPDDAMQGRSGQVLRLHEAVAQSILLVHYTPFMPLPTKRDDFAWSLGEGAQEIAANSDAPDARYALFLYARGSYASGGRIAAVAVGAALGVGVTMGGQDLFASLVDLSSGDIVWFNVARAGVNADMREPGGAAALVESLLQSAPL
ncbi:MAG: hypothetical protein KGS44_01975 [Alphaproteobacteria bacterium]|jgi:hypothetical protein|nr:hypothetical protein [Alphaproteobacteria bacterium]